METLFFLIVLAIIIVSNIVNIKKRLKDASPGESSGGKKEGKSGIKGVIAQIKSELEQATAEPAGQRQRSSGWEDLIPEYGADQGRTEAEPADKASAETRQPTDREEGGKTRMESLKHQGKTPEARMDRADRADRADLGQRADRVQRQTPEKKNRPEEPERQAPVAAEPQSRRPRGEKPAPVYGMTGGGRRRVYSAKQLQQAVVWSEILGRPVGLRGQDQDVWM
ncbi:MAG: hypothetical protein ACQERN_12350 [Thermodesulfobacteriota bacterium]